MENPPTPEQTVPRGKPWRGSASVPWLLAVITFLVYAPSLKSDFVYDARAEILMEGFIPNLANLPAVLSLKVMHMNVMLAPRPGQMLYLMAIASVSGQRPFGYHLGSNLLHAANVALLFVLLRRLLAQESVALLKSKPLLLAAIASTLVFALHPIATETVANIAYSSDLLVTFFTLAALLTATWFRPGNTRMMIPLRCVVLVCVLAAVMCKESGIAVTALLIVYWYLYRRSEANGHWFGLLFGSGVAVAAFLGLRFYHVPVDLTHGEYIINSVAQFISIQPRLWIFMLGQIVWPTHLSADYEPGDLGALTTISAVTILAMVVSLQAGLAWKSRMGALGVAVYWLGLATVSNVIPLYRPFADRFYYLPMVGVTLQIMAIFVIVLKFRPVFWSAAGACWFALAPLTLLTLTRQEVFTNEVTLWSDTLQKNPGSALACTNLGAAYMHEGRMDLAEIYFERALEIDPTQALAHFNFGWALDQEGQTDAAIAQYEIAIGQQPTYLEAHNNLAIALFQKGRVNEAIGEFEKALELRPGDRDIQENLQRAKASLPSTMGPK